MTAPRSAQLEQVLDCLSRTLSDLLSDEVDARSIDGATPLNAVVVADTLLDSLDLWTCILDLEAAIGMEFPLNPRIDSSSATWGSLLDVAVECVKSGSRALENG